MQVIHKINITDEAKLDVMECVGLKAFDWRMLKSETEEYITHLSRARRIPYWGYFRADYIDKKSDKRLKLFIYKGQAFGAMQIWDIKGVCEADEWTQETEDDGQIRTWLETKVDELPIDSDWVIRARLYKVLSNTNQTLWIDFLEEATNAFEYEGDKEAAAEVAFLQSAHFKFRGRRVNKKNKRR